MREAIERPAYLVGCELEPGLTALLLDDVRSQAGALPLLQFTLEQLWAKRAGRRLTHEAFEELGRVQGALQHQADATFRSFGLAEQELCRRIFLRLVHPGEGTEDTKRRVSLRELLPDDPVQAEAVQRVLLRLSDRRGATDHDPRGPPRRVMGVWSRSRTRP